MNEMINLKLCDDIDPIHEDYFNPMNPRVPPPPPTFCVMHFWGYFLHENVNLMGFVRDVVIESLVLIRYGVYFCTSSREFLIVQECIRETSLRHCAFLDHFCINMLAR